ncbi:MAG TPA: hypothetical protein VEZ41_01745, partial [Allosphingosinicella sp.]|nr:hypothetical protein [Allosphingosinicella sp.]
MATKTAPARPARGKRAKRPRSRARRLWLWPFTIIMSFLILSFLWVLLYRVVNPPLTLTQL